MSPPRTAKVLRALAVLALKVFYAAAFLVLRCLGILVVLAAVLAIAYQWYGPAGGHLAIYILGAAVTLWAFICFPARALRIVAVVATPIPDPWRSGDFV